MRWVVLVAVLLFGGSAALFAVQNSSRTTQLSFDLGVAAWQLSEPVSVPALIAVCVGIGFLLGAVPLGLRSLRLGSRVRELEANVAVNQALGKDAGAKDPGSW
ncbi:MAG: hypothetical protein KC621_22990 [Myxococcales bacterium]|nr:hypothetical protein [Myxococcales bacterium]